MRLSVECGGFTRAADACRTANQIAALLTESLSSRLADCAGMAGDDAASSGFARAYDDGAREAMLALADLTHSYIGIGRLLTATGLNHAERRGGGCRPGRLGIRRGQPRRRRLRAGPSGSTTAEPGASAAVAQPGGRVDPRPDRGLRLAGRRCHEGARSRHGVAPSSRLRGRPDRSRRRGQRLPGPSAIPRSPARAVGARRPHDPDRRHRVAARLACECVRGVRRCSRGGPCAHPRPAGRDRSDGRRGRRALGGGHRGDRRTRGGAAAAVALARVRAYAPRFHALLVALRAGTATATARLRTAQEELVAVRRRAEKFLARVAPARPRRCVSS